MTRVLIPALSLIVFNTLWCVQGAAAGYECLQAFVESSDRRFITDNHQENAVAMRANGYSKALKLIRRYSHLVRPGQTVLELGPYYNPLALAFDSDIHWLVWEYDGNVAQEIASRNDGPPRTVFNIDLNSLNEGRWRRFLAANDTALGLRQVSPSFGAAIFSSVFNYVNYRVVLKNIFPRLVDGGLLIVANSETAMGLPVTKISRATPTIGVTEHLLATYGDHLEILEGSEIHSYSGVVPSQIALALKVHKAPLDERRDQYDAAVMIYLENATTIPGEDKIVRDKLSSLSLKSGSEREHNLLRQDWGKRKLRLLEEYHAESHQLIEDVCHADQWQEGFSWERFNEGKKSVADLRFFLKKIRHYQLIPERRILLKSLEIVDLERRRDFLNEEISALYRRLNHEPHWPATP